MRTRTLSKGPNDVNFVKSPGTGVATMLILESLSSLLRNTVAVRDIDNVASERVQVDGGAANR